MAELQASLRTALSTLAQAVATDSAGGVRITTRGCEPWISVPAIGKVPEPPTLGAFSAEIQRRWGTLDLLEVLKDADFLTGLTDEFSSMAAREVTARAAVRRRLLVVLFGLGTNMGLKRIADALAESGGSAARSRSSTARCRPGGSAVRRARPPAGAIPGGGARWGPPRGPPSRGPSRRAGQPLARTPAGRRDRLEGDGGQDGREELAHHGIAGEELALKMVVGRARRSQSATAAASVARSTRPNTDARTWSSSTLGSSSTATASRKARAAASRRQGC